MAQHKFIPVQSFPIQGRRGAGDIDGASKYSCSSCRIDYHVKEGLRAVCPLCEAEDRNAALRRQIDTLAQELEMVKGDLKRAQSEADIMQTMRHALSMAEATDIAEIKAIAYRWRADPHNISVRTMQMNKQRKLAIELQSRQGDCEVFIPISVGGVVFVASFHDLIKARGTVRAMDGYAQAIAGKLV